MVSAESDAAPTSHTSSGTKAKQTEARIRKAAPWPLHATFGLDLVRGLASTLVRAECDVHPATQANRRTKARFEKCPLLFERVKKSRLARNAPPVQSPTPRSRSNSCTSVHALAAPTPLVLCSATCSCSSPLPLTFRSLVQSCALLADSVSLQVTGTDLESWGSSDWPQGWHPSIQWTWWSPRPPTPSWLSGQAWEHFLWPGWAQATQPPLPAQPSDTAVSEDALPQPLRLPEVAFPLDFCAAARESTHSPGTVSPSTGVVSTALRDHRLSVWVPQPYLVSMFFRSPCRLPISSLGLTCPRSHESRLRSLTPSAAARLCSCPPCAERSTPYYARGP